MVEEETGEGEANWAMAEGKTGEETIDEREAEEAGLEAVDA